MTNAFTPNDFSSSLGDGLSLFASGTSLYLLSSSSLFSVDESTAALTQLGTVTSCRQASTTSPVRPRRSSSFPSLPT